MDLKEGAKDHGGERKHTTPTSESPVISAISKAGKGRGVKKSPHVMNMIGYRE
jgi:hypothetical protein